MTADALTDTPRLLALDTATDTLYLSVCAPAGQWHRQAAGGAQASAALLPAVAALLREAGLALADLDALAYGQGPGAFTGLRTACSVVQGLALGSGRPVLPLDTLQAVAESARLHGATGPVWAMQDARMGEVYAALYEPVATTGWRTLEPAALHRPDALARRAGGQGAAWAGNALKVYPELQHAAVERFADAVPDGPALMALALQAWRRGEACDAAQALPLYVRDKVAQTTAERRAGTAQPG